MRERTLLTAAAGVAILIGALTPGACDAQATLEDASLVTMKTSSAAGLPTTSLSVASIMTSPPLPPITTSAEATEQAVRISAPSPPPPPTPYEIVMTLPYSFGDLDPAIIAFQQVAGVRGWAQADINAWTPFVRYVMARESGGCPNLRRGAKFANPHGEGCTLRKQGAYSDSGFGQVLMSIHRKWLCPQEGLCTPQDVVSNPWNSMTAFVALVERSGSQPWCYTAKLRRGQACRLAP